MQAIETKYHGPTNVRGSRCSATADAGQITLGWDYALNSDQNHGAAAVALCEKFGWTGKLVGGSLKRGTMAWVFVYDDSIEVK